MRKCRPCMWGALALAASLPARTGASILAAGAIETCVNDGGPQSCSTRLLATLSVQNGQNRTESIESYRVRDIEDAQGRPAELEDRIEVTLAKSSIVLRYPLRYTRTYNAKPKELVLVRDEAGKDYNWLTNPCKDGTSADAACGAVLDSGDAVPYSQGFCCRCSVEDYLGGGPAGLSRAGLQCSLLSSERAQSAHCLRWGPLWYRAYEMSPPVTHYTIEADVTFCPASDPSACSTQTVLLSPSLPGQCVTIAALSGASSSGDEHPCDVLLSLEGDFAAFEAAKSFASSLLMRPHTCDDFATCGAQMTETPERWLVVPRSSVTTGSECDKVGVSHQAFSGQSQRCERLVGACLDAQLSDLYDADAAAEARGEVGSHFVRFHGYGGRFALDESKPGTTLALFETTRFQKTVVSMQVAADRLAYRIKVARGVFVAVAAPAFEAKSGAGLLLAEIRNDGPVSGDITVTVNCSAGAVAPVLTYQVTLGPGEADTARLRLEASGDEGASAACTASLLDGLFRVTDTRTVTVRITAVVDDRGSQGGELEDGAPVQSQGVGPGTAAAAQCHERCAFTDPMCALMSWCFRRFAEYAGVLLGCTVAVALLLRVPRLLMQAGAAPQRKRSRRRRSSSGSSQSR